MKKQSNLTPYDLFKLRELKRCIKSPVYFIENYVKIQCPNKGIIRFELHDYQKDLINLYNTNNKTVVKMPRQTGKTTCAAGFLLWRAMFESYSRILMASYNQDSSFGIMQNIRIAHERLPDFLRAGALKNNEGTMEFDNGSKITASSLTNGTGLGLSLSLLYLDEFAFVEPRLAQEFLQGIMPTLTRGSQCIISSTPSHYKNHEFINIWNNVEFNGFVPYSVDWKDIPRRESLEEYKKYMITHIGEEQWKREYACEV